MTTPRTDKEAFDVHEGATVTHRTKCVDGAYVDADFARELERELSEARTAQTGMTEQDKWEAEAGAYDGIQPCPPKKGGRVGTHWVGCWESHHECAMAEIKRLQHAVEALRLCERYLVERGIEHKGTVGRTQVLPAIRKALESLHS